MKLGGFKDFDLTPLVGLFDSRTPSGKLAIGDFRVVLNMSLTEDKKRCRMGGWKRLLKDSPYGFKNQDLHDQMLDCAFYYDTLTEALASQITILDYVDYGGYVYSQPTAYSNNYCGGTLYTRTGCREAVTMLFDAASVAGKRRLLAATKSRIYAMNDRSGNWRLLADGLGGAYNVNECDCSSRRFKVAQLGNMVLFTNNFDPVMFWQFDSGPAGCDFWSADYVPDLVSLEITKAKVVAAWAGFVFIANIEEAANRLTNRIHWSDYNSPLSWSPASDSKAGFIELGAGERVQAMEALGGQLRVYTARGQTRAIYDVQFVGGAEVFSFREIYRGPDGIEFDYSLVNAGSAHYWLAESGLMMLGEYDRTPQRIEWMHKATGVIYKGLPGAWVTSFAGLSGFDPVNRSACDQVIGGFDSELKNLWFSWPTGSNECPNMSLVLNVAYGSASLVDRGFTAFVNYQPDYVRSVRDFLIEFGGCYSTGLVEVKEGEPYASYPSQGAPTYIRNYGEDPNADPSANSLCARLVGTELEDLCELCAAESIFVMADAADKTLKEFAAGTYYRERYVDEVTVYECPNTTPGSYALDGYYSMLQIDAVDFGKKEEKLTNNVAVDFDAEEQTTPNNLNLQVAYGQQPACMTWTDTTPRELACITDFSAAQHAANNTRPDLMATFPTYRRGVYLAWRFWVNGTGGGACFNKVTQAVALAQGAWR